MKYTGVVRKVPVVDMISTGNSYPDDIGYKFLGYVNEGKFRDSEGNEEWRASKVLTK